MTRLSTIKEMREELWSREILADALGAVKKHDRHKVYAGWKARLYRRGKNRCKVCGGKLK